MLLALPNHAFFLHTSSPFPLGFSLASMLSTIYDKWGGVEGGPILPSKNGVALTSEVENCRRRRSRLKTASEEATYGEKK